MKNSLLLLLALCLAAPSFAQSDTDGVRMAVEDYRDALYEADASKIERSVSTDLVKYGYWRSSAEEAYQGSPMTYDQLHGLAQRWNSDNRQGINEDSPREIVVMDVLDKTAVAKLTAQWGIDYFQLEKTDGKWMIRHIIWQAHPAEDG